MYLVLGLGNPEKKYLNNYHNIGFMAVDRLCERLDFEFKKKQCKAITAEGLVNGEKIILAKPLTYMNLSGESAVMLAHKYKIPEDKFAVVYDDIDIEKGLIRIRAEGSAGTHNGMKSVISFLSEKFLRVRVGISKPPEHFELHDFVLSNIQDGDKEILNNSITKASDALYDFVNGMKAEELMRKYNGK